MRCSTVNVQASPSVNCRGALKPFVACVSMLQHALEQKQRVAQGFRGLAQDPDNDG